MESLREPILLLVDQPLLKEKLGTVGRVVGLGDLNDAELRASIRVLVAGGMAPLGRDLLDRLPALGLIALPAAGYSGIDLEDAARRSLFVTNVRAINHEDVADAAIGMMIALARGLLAGQRMLREGRWALGRVPPARSLRSRKVGIVGMGNIGAAVAKRCAAFGCQVTWWGPREKPDAVHPRASSLLALAEATDTLFVCALADETTRGLVGRPVLDALGKDGIIVNVSRGSLVDEGELLDAVVQSRIAGAALDVFETEPTPPARWPDNDRLLLTPHLAGVTRESLEGMFEAAAHTVADFLSGRPPTDPLCAPRGVTARQIDPALCAERSATAAMTPVSEGQPR